MLMGFLSRLLGSEANFCDPFCVLLAPLELFPERIQGLELKDTPATLYFKAKPGTNK